MSTSDLKLNIKLYYTYGMKVNEMLKNYVGYPFLQYTVKARYSEPRYSEQ